MTWNKLVVSALSWSGLQFHSWDWMQRSISCQVPSIQLRIIELWRVGMEVDLKKKKHSKKLLFEVFYMRLQCLQLI